MEVINGNIFFLKNVTAFMGNSPKKWRQWEDHVGMADFSSHGWILKGKSTG